MLTLEGFVRQPKRISSTPLVESYLVYEKEHKVRHCQQLCLLLVVSTLKQALKDCKTFDFSVFAGIS